MSKLVEWWLCHGCQAKDFKIGREAASMLFFWKLENGPIVAIAGKNLLRDGYSIPHGSKNRQVASSQVGYSKVWILAVGICNCIFMLELSGLPFSSSNWPTCNSKEP